MPKAPTPEPGPAYIVGDIHGHRDKLVRLLREAGLIDEGEAWTGGRSRLWALGDLVDRGPDGVGVIALLRRLQDEAADAGGEVGVLVGNHDLTFLAAERFGDGRAPDGHSFRWHWERNGGQPSDLSAVTDEQVRWLCDLPSMARLDDLLLVHADAMFYTYFGASLQDVNGAVKDLIASEDPEAWGTLLEAFGQRRAFLAEPGGTDLAARFLAQFGGSRLVHGHCPIPNVLKVNPENVTEPYVYAGGLCVNVDGGMYLGGPGFIYQPAAVFTV